MHKIPKLSRRGLLSSGVTLSAAVLGGNAPAVCRAMGLFRDGRKPSMRFGLVTYQWGKDWDVPTLIANCHATGLLGVELRTTHAHMVEPDIGPARREEVKKLFDDSPVELVGIGSNERFDSPDAAELQAAIDATKAFVKLSHDVGGSGVKVKPNSFHEGVPRARTIEQIGKSLNTVATFAADYGQEIRLEAHGQCAPLPVMKSIMDVADHPNARICWNSNQEDLADKGLEYNFRLVRPCFGRTAHVRELNGGDYPYEKLIRLFVETNYSGWILLEARTSPQDRVAAMIEQRKLFEQLVKNSMV